MSGAAEFEEWLRENQQMVFRVAYSVVGNAEDAEEVSQEVFLRAYKKLASLREAGSFRAWVARMSWRLALNRRRSLLRSLRRETTWWSQGQFPESPTDTSLSLRQQIARLPRKLRSVILLTAVNGLDSGDVARILGVPEGTVRSRLHLARKQLLKGLYG